jgi:hypothetical protein
MPRRRASVDLEDVINIAVDAAFDRGADFFSRMREQQVAQLPPQAKTATYVCMAGCKKPNLTLDQMEVISAPVPGYGMCKGCFAFTWQAAKEKVAYLNRRAAEARAAQPAAPAAEPTPRPPWVILGVDRDASAEDIKKAWKRLAAQYHPDMVPPGPNSEQEKAAARLKFEEVTRARDVLLKLRQPAA